MRIDIDVPDGSCGNWSVESFTVSEEEARFSAIRAFHYPWEYIPPGHYKRLMHSGSVIMSNTRMEIDSHFPIIQHAQGNVLLNGLGLGMVLKAVLDKPEVQHVVVVEIALEVINLVWPTYKHDNRVTLVQADALTYSPERGVRYNAVWHDIWPSICADNLYDMMHLHRKYGRRCDWQRSWMWHQCERLARR